MEISAPTVGQVGISLTASENLEALQVKSAERVRDLGEVFTPAATVGAMLDLLPADVWEVHPSATFLEPACGDGNFLVAILDRKLAAIVQAGAAHALPAGATNDGVQFHALEALASIYAVDISVENVIGGSPGHEVGAQDRLLAHLKAWYATAVGGRLTERSAMLLAARWIVERNVQVGNMLALNTDGTSSGWEKLPLVEYQWDPSSMSVKLLVTTLGALMEATAAETSDTMRLFGPPEPSKIWEGKALRLPEAPIGVPAPA